MSATEDSFVPDMSRRQAMNLILASSVGINVLGLAVPYIAFFVPPGSGNSAGGVVAHDAIGNDVTVESWIATHAVGSRELAEGIKVRRFSIQYVHKSFSTTVVFTSLSWFQIPQLEGGRNQHF